MSTQEIMSIKSNAGKSNRSNQTQEKRVKRKKQAGPDRKQQILQQAVEIIAAEGYGKSNYSLKSKKLIVMLLLATRWPCELMKHPHYKYGCRY
jgi:predicted Fe-Mo cluster-binding NifX family protein